MNSSHGSEKKLRLLYIERFSPEKVERACRKANWHRARALKMGRTAHFTAWQWLDLCASQGWSCAYCGEMRSLEPHHRHELHKGGLNTLENLDAICKTCHERTHEWPDDVSQAWMAYQNALLERFRRLALGCGAVRLSSGTREENRTRSRGILLEFHAPECGKVPLRGLLPRSDWQLAAPPAPIHALNQDWWDGRASAQVQWHAGGMWEERVFLSHLAPVEPVSPQKMTRVGAREEQKTEAKSQLVLGF